MKLVVILLPLLLHLYDEILTTEGAVLANFYPFGQSQGDQLLPPNDDQSSGTVPISIQFPFFDQNHNSLFVSRKSLYYYTCTVGWQRKRTKGQPEFLSWRRRYLYLNLTGSVFNCHLKQCSSIDQVGNFYGGNQKMGHFITYSWKSSNSVERKRYVSLRWTKRTKYDVYIV